MTPTPKPIPSVDPANPATGAGPAGRGTEARVRITHPAGMLLAFPATHKKVMQLVVFGIECVDALDSKQETWSYEI